MVGKTCGAFSTIVTLNPRLARFSAISKPIKPAPIIVALLGALAFK